MATARLRPDDGDTLSRWMALQEREREKFEQRLHDHEQLPVHALLAVVTDMKERLVRLETLVLTVGGTIITLLLGVLGLLLKIVLHL